MKKLLVIAESIDVEDSSGSKANVALIRNLAKAGFQILVYHYTRKEIHLKDIPCVALKENRKSLLFFLSRIERHLRYRTGWLVNETIEKVLGFSFTLFNDRNSIVAGLKNSQDFEPDLVLTLSKGGSFRPHHAMLKIPEWHSKWMAYIHDPYPMHSYPRPYDWVEPGHQKKRKFFLQVAEKAKYAAYPSQLLAEWMESYFPPLKGKRIVLPHQIDTDFKIEALPEFFKQDYFTVVHAGALMSARNPMCLINAFKRFLAEFPEAKKNSQLLFLGKKSRYTREFQKVKNEMPQFYSSDSNLSFTTVIAIQRAASVNVILEAKGPISPFLPGKFPHCIQAGKPILLLGPYYSESKRLLGEDYPWWSEIDDEEKILTHLILLYRIWRNDSTLLRQSYSELKEYLSEKHLRRVIHSV